MSTDLICSGENAIYSPFAPHICEEIWQNLGHDQPVHHQPWPVWDEEAIKKQEVEIAVQINGKVKSKLTIPMDADEDSVYEAVMADEKIQKATDGMNIIKRIYIKNRLMNVIVKPQ